MSLTLLVSERGAPVSSLPRKPVRLPVENVWQLAVLSWRWDFTRGASNEPRSRNLAAAVKYCQSSGIQYLFADVISIDQTLEDSQLIQQVKQFSRLYETIPVIAAYDQQGSKLFETMRRPWIFSETRLIRRNPTKIIYVGHINKQGSYILNSPFSSFLGRLPQSKIAETNFARELILQWESDFVTSILQVLNGTTHMTNIFDFKLIIPTLGCILTTAERLGRNDYLLTVALLSSSSKYTNGHKVTGKFMGLAYRFYQILGENINESTPQLRSSQRNGEYKFKEINSGTNYMETHTVLVGGQRVAEFNCYEQGWHPQSTMEYSLRVFPTAERAIFDMLRLDEVAYKRYVSRKEDLCSDLHMSRFQEGPGLEVVAVDLSKT